MNDFVITDDIQIKDGDLVIADSDSQEVEFTLLAKPGQFYQYPTFGVGIEDEINGNISKQELKLKIKNNLENDNRRVNSIEISGNIDQLIADIDSTRLL